MRCRVVWIGGVTPIVNIELPSLPQSGSLVVPYTKHTRTRRSSSHRVSPWARSSHSQRVHSVPSTRFLLSLSGSSIKFLRSSRLPVTVVASRYRKGQATVIGNLWWEMHQDCMVVCAEALLPLAITAIFTTGGPHTSEHARWGEQKREIREMTGLGWGGTLVQ